MDEGQEVQVEQSEDEQLQMEDDLNDQDDGEEG